MRNREEKKKRKGQESTIGKIIYGFLLFLPLFAIGVTCGYAMFNKNAYISFQEEQQLHSDYGNTNVVNNVQTQWVVLGNDLNLFANSARLNYKVINLNDEQNYLFLFKVSSYTSTNNQIHLNLTDYENYQMSTITDNHTNNFIYYNYYCENEGKYSLNLYHHSAVWNCNFLGYSIVPVPSNFDIQKEKNNLNSLITNQTITVINQRTDLNNVFYYSIDKVQQSPLFNWAENSIIYTTTASTCNALSITTPFIPLLMSYWLIISIIYFLYDIAIMLVWIIHRKIHELQESI